MNMSCKFLKEVSTFVILIFCLNFPVSQCPECHNFFKKGKLNNFPPVRCFYCWKIVVFVVYCLLVFLWLVSFGLIYVFIRLKSVLKKNKQAWNCTDNLKYYITDVCPYQTAYGEFICKHVSLTVRIFGHLWESLLFARIFLNPWESPLSSFLRIYFINFFIKMG